MAKGVKTGGRQKGTTNKITAAAKDAIALAAEALGGIDRIVAWAKEDPLNERAFWATIYPKLIPVTLAGDAENPLIIAEQNAERFTGGIARIVTRTGTSQSNKRTVN